MLNRVNLVESLFNGWIGTDFEWGMRDCVCLCAADLFAFGYRINFKPGIYGTEIGAIKTIRKAGYTDLIDAVDGQPMLKRIAPASAMVGDLLGMLLPDRPRWAALSVVLGNGRVLGFFSPDENPGKCVVLEPKSLSDCIAWRVP